MVATTGRVAQSAVKRWLGDPGTYPILVTCGVATAMVTYQCTRYITSHPDVNWNKKNRADIFRYNEEKGADWQSHRRSFATLRKNVVNESKGL